MISEFQRGPLAVEPNWLKLLNSVSADVLAGMAPLSRQPVTREGDAAVISLRGPLFPYPNRWTGAGFGTSLEAVQREFTRAVASDAEKIILNVDSPGGILTGVNELAEQIYTERKRVIAYVGGMAASGAYWITSVAGRIVVDATGELGSVGVVMQYRDTREADKKRGVERIEIVSSVSPNKRPDPKTDSGLSELQRRVDDLAGVFVNVVARNRLSPTDVVAGWAGSVLVGADAVRRGMADGLGSLDDAVNGTTRQPTSHLKPGATAMSAEKPKEPTISTLWATSLAKATPDLGAEPSKRPDKPNHSDEWAKTLERAAGAGSNGG